MKASESGLKQNAGFAIDARSFEYEQRRGRFAAPIRPATALGFENIDGRHG
jgi:hypothetical protein